MEYRVKFLENEYFRGGTGAYGTDMPINADSHYTRDLRYGLEESVK